MKQNVRTSVVSITSLGLNFCGSLISVRHCVWPSWKVSRVLSCTYSLLSTEHTTTITKRKSPTPLPSPFAFSRTFWSLYHENLLTPARFYSMISVSWEGGFAETPPHFSHRLVKHSHLFLHNLGCLNLFSSLKTQDTEFRTFKHPNLNSVGKSFFH